jgi:hypothetical protein
MGLYANSFTSFIIEEWTSHGIHVIFEETLMWFSVSHKQEFHKQKTSGNGFQPVNKLIWTLLWQIELERTS